jgi:hypothetical protein
MIELIAANWLWILLSAATVAMHPAAAAATVTVTAMSTPVVSAKGAIREPR